MQFSRNKKKSFLLAILYRTFFGPLSGLMSNKKKMRLFCYLTWIFDRLAINASYQYYKALDHPGRKLTCDFLLPHIQEQFTVLDLGCGYGHYSNIIAQKAKEVVGVDYNAGHIALAKKNYTASNISFLHDDAYHFLVNNNKRFDVLILAHVLEHLDNPKEFLNKYKVFFNYMYIEVPDFNKDLLNTFRKDLDSPYIYTDEDHINEFERGQIKEIIESCGLTIEDARYTVGVQYLWIRC